MLYDNQIMSDSLPESGETLEVSVTQAARGFADVVNRVFYRRERFVLTKGGRPVAEIGPLRGAPVLTARDLLGMWSSAPHLSPEEAEAFAADVASAREALTERGRDPWE